MPHFGFFTNQLLSNGINTRVSPAWGYWCFALTIFILLREYQEENNTKRKEKHSIPQWRKNLSSLPLVQIIQKEREKEQQEQDEKIHVLNIKN